MKILAAATLLLGCLPAIPSVAQDSKQSSKSDDMQNCPMHQQHMEDAHHAAVNKHGDQAMGFAHYKTTHHFLLASDGGTIDLTTNEAGDKTNAEAIRSHLSHIALAFTDGDFSAPMFIHDGIPPGVTTMQLLKAAIHYQYEEITSGGRVRIVSADPIAVAAIHDFLRFQITEHRTGDNLSSEKAH